MAKAVDHGGGQQHADDAEDAHNGEDEELGGFSLAVLGGDLLDLASLWATKQDETQKSSQHFSLFYFSFGSFCSSKRPGTANTVKK